MSFRVRLPGLSAARLATGRVALWSEDVPQRPLWPPSAAHGLLDIYPHVRMEMQPPGVEPGRPTQRVLGPLPYRLGHGCRVRAVGFEPTQGLDPPAPRAGAVVRLATHAMRPAGFGPAITAVSERRVWRIISPLRCQATLRALGWRRSPCVTAEFASAGVSSAVHGWPRPDSDRECRVQGAEGCRFPTGLSSPRRDSNADPLAQDEVRLPLAPRG